MNAASILRSKTAAIVSAGFLGAGLLGGVAFAAVPTTSDTVAMTAPDTSNANATDEKARAKLKAVLDALVAKNVITQAQEDAIVSALTTVAKHEHPKLRELVGDVANESVSYLGLPADQVKQQLRSGKSLGEIANATAGKSRDGLLSDLDAKAADRIQAAVAAGTITKAQADQLTPKVDDAIVKIVDHKGSPKPTATN
jgi:membrane peptidoglycan carboxypeptidase